MYAAIRQVKAKAGKADELAQRIRGAVPIISGVSGFMGYYVIYAPDDTVTAISIFNTVEQAQSPIDARSLGSKRISDRSSSGPPLRLRGRLSCTRFPDPAPA